MNFDSYWASYKVISLRPKKSMENNLFQNKAFIPVTKKILACFAHITEYGRHRLTFVRRHKVFLANKVQFKKSFL